MCNLTKSCASTSSTTTTTTTKIPLFANPSTNNKLCRLLDHTTFEKDLLQLLSFQNTERFPNFPALFQKLCASLAAQLCIKVS